MYTIFHSKITCQNIRNKLYIEGIANNLICNATFLGDDHALAAGVMNLNFNKRDASENKYFAKDGTNFSFITMPKRNCILEVG